MNINLDNITLKDSRDFLEFRENHDKEFFKFCNGNPLAGAEDELDNHFDYLIKAFRFFDDKGYIK